jgi:hypothetical protein
MISSQFDSIRFYSIHVSQSYLIHYILYSTLISQRLIFGPAKDEWMKPPSFIGGGIGMKLCTPAAATAAAAAVVVTGHVGGESDNDADLNVDSVDVDGDVPLHAHTHCKTFQIVYSAEFSRLHEQYSMIANSGDVNRLALFLSQHPYHPEGACWGTLYCTIRHCTA